MGIITGYISLICLLFLLFKFITRIFRLNKLNTICLKTHKYVAFLFLGVTFIHFILVLKVWETRSIILSFSGIAIFLVGILLIFFYHTVKNRKVERILHRSFYVIMAILLIVHLISYFADFRQYKSAINRAESIDDVDLFSMCDGEYIGEYDAGYIYAKVKVTISDNAIAKVDLLEHKHERGIRAESIVDHMVKEQKIDVDAISGATNSSIVIKKAVANALLK